jgi:hypothetical protein
VEVTNGNITETFTVLRLLLTTHAPAFAKAFAHPSIRAIKIDNVPPKTFDIFLGWLRMEFWRNTGEGEALDPWDDAENHPKWILDDEYSLEWNSSKNDPLMWNFVESPIAEYAEVAIDMFVFAKAYDTPRLEQDALDRLVWCHNMYKLESRSTSPLLRSAYISSSSINKICDITEPGSLVQRMLSDGWFEYGNCQNDELLESLPKSLLIQVMRAIVKDGCIGTGFPFEACDWHGHETEEEKLGCIVRVRMNVEEQFAEYLRQVAYREKRRLGQQI